MTLHHDTFTDWENTRKTMMEIAYFFTTKTDDTYTDMENNHCVWELVFECKFSGLSKGSRVSKIC